MKKMKTNKLLTLVLLFFAFLFASGVSSWLIITQDTFNPVFIDKFTPSVATLPSYEMFGTGTPTLTNADAWQFNDPITNTKIEGTLTESAFEEPTEGTEYVDGTTDSSFVVYRKVTFTPNDDETYTSVTVEAPVTIKAVAYISGGGRNYYTIESALNKNTSGTIYTVIGANPTIKNSCTIASGVTLTMPFELDSNGVEVYKVSDDISITTNKTGFADRDGTNIKANLKNKVTITNATLTVNGALNIGGLTGTEGNGVAGQTTGSYTQISMSNNTKILIEGGTLNCYGYIKQTTNNAIDSQVVVGTKDTVGTINAPFVVYDYRGGSSTVGTYAQNGSSYVNMYTSPNNITPNICPFMVYDMPNIQTQLRINYQGVLKGLADLYTGEMKFDIPVIGEVGSDAQHNRTSPTIIANSNSIIDLANADSFALTKYEPKWNSSGTESYTVSDGVNGRTTIDLFNGASSGALKLSLSVMGKTISIDTSKVLLPINWKFDISLNNGSYTFGTKMKLMTGAKIVVNDDATLDVNSEFIVYSSFTDNCPLGYQYPKKNAAEFIVNGTANINNSFGGKIKTSYTGAKLVVKDGINLSMSSSEGYGGRDSLSTVYTEVANIKETASSDLLLYSVDSTDTITFGATLVAGTSYLADSRENKTYDEGIERPWIAQNQTLTLSFGSYKVNLDINSQTGSSITEDMKTSLENMVTTENPSFVKEGNPYITTSSGNLDASEFVFFNSITVYQEYGFTGYLITFNANTTTMEDNDYKTILNGVDTQYSSTANFKTEITNHFNAVTAKIDDFNEDIYKKYYFAGWTYKVTAPNGEVIDYGSTYFDPKSFTFDDALIEGYYKLDLTANWIEKVLVSVKVNLTINTTRNPFGATYKATHKAVISYNGTQKELTDFTKTDVTEAFTYSCYLMEGTQLTITTTNGKNSTTTNNSPYIVTKGMAQITVTTVCCQYKLF